MMSHLEPGWFAAARAWAVALVVLFCACPGFGQDFPAQSPHGSMVLRVLSYNVHGVGLPAPDQGRYAIMGKLLRALRQSGDAPHIIALQEFWQQRATELIKIAGYPYVQLGTSGQWPRLGSGIVILSDFPLSEHQSHAYTQCASWDCFAKKSVQHVRVDIPGLPQPVDLYNTHLNSDPDTDPVTSSEETREARYSQTQELREFIWDTHVSTRPLLFPGDFNMLPSEDAYQSFIAFSSLFDAAQDCGLHPERCASTSDPHQDWKSSDDHQFYLSGTSPQVTLEPVRFEKILKSPPNGPELSDHAGLLIHYRVTW